MKGSELAYPHSAQLPLLTHLDTAPVDRARSRSERPANA